MAIAFGTRGFRNERFTIITVGTNRGDAVVTMLPFIRLRNQIRLAVFQALNFLLVSGIFSETPRRLDFETVRSMRLGEQSESDFHVQVQRSMYTLLIASYFRWLLRNRTYCE